MRTNNVAAQRARLELALRLAGSDGITTIEAREHLNILAPAARVFELRHMSNLNIATLWSNQEDAQGRKHRIAKYVFISNCWRAKA